MLRARLLLRILPAAAAAAAAAAAVALGGCFGDDPSLAPPSSPAPDAAAPTGPPQEDAGEPRSSSVTPSATSLAFPVTAPGDTSESAELRLTAFGGAPTRPLEAAVIGGALASSFSVASDGCRDQTLAPGASCAIGIAFSPKAEGAATATLSVGSVTVALSGMASVFEPEDVEHAAENALDAVYALDPTRVYAVGKNGRVVVSTDGATWAKQDVQATGELRTVFASGDGHVYVGGTGPILLVKSPTSSGFDVVTLPPGSPTAIDALWATPQGAVQNTVFAVGEGGKYLTFAVGATPSTAQKFYVSTAAFALTGHYDSSLGGNITLCAAGDNHTTVNYSSAAGGWTGPWQGVPVSLQLRGVWTNGTNTVAVGSNGEIARLTGCTTFVDKTAIQGAPTLYGIWGGGSETDLWAVGSGGTILHSTSPGIWTKVESGTTRDLRGIHGTGPSNLYVVGDGVILHKKKR